MKPVEEKTNLHSLIILSVWCDALKSYKTIFFNQFNLTRRFSPIYIPDKNKIWSKYLIFSSCFLHPEIMNFAQYSYAHGMCMEVNMYVWFFQRYTYNLSIQFGNADRKIKLYNAACPLPRRQLSDPTGNSCWFFAPNDYWLCQHPYHLLHCYCISGFSFPCVYYRHILHDFKLVLEM